VAAGQLIACADDGRSVREAVEGLQILYRVEVEIAACGEDVLQFGQTGRLDCLASKIVSGGCNDFIVVRRCSYCSSECGSGRDAVVVCEIGSVTDYENEPSL
jgi:hypothetical protein